MTASTPAVTASAPDLEAVLGSTALPRDKARAATAMVQLDGGARLAGVLLRHLDAFRPPERRAGPDAAPFLGLIAAADAAGLGELASALGLVLRDRVVPHDPQGPAGRYLSGAGPDDLTSREALWRCAAALGEGALHQRLRARYARLHPYWRNPREEPGVRVLILNRLPNLMERDPCLVHNQSNIPHGYEQIGSTPGFVFDVFFLCGTDFDAVKDRILPPTVVYNNVLSAEVLTREGHGPLMHRIADHFGVPLINPPEQCLPFTRVANFERIGAQAHYVFPRTVHLAPGFDVETALERIETGFDWPVILRDCFGHMGGGITLARSAREARAPLQRLRAAGAYAIQYHDLPQPNGLYFRYRMLKIGEEVFSSNARADEGWNVHSKEHEALKLRRPELGLAEIEAQFWDAPTELVPRPTWAALEDLLRGTGADVMGCDFTLMPDGRALIFELNPSMHVKVKGRAAFERLCGFTGNAAPVP